MLRAMELRRATDEDAEALGRGMKTVADEDVGLLTQSDATVEELTTMFRASIEVGDILFVLKEDGELAGSLGLHPAGAKGVLGLGMWVLPDRRRRGAGRMLVEAALAARPADVHKIELEVFPENDAAIALYEATGFEREGMRRDHYRRLDGSLRSAVIMARLFD
jgi:ribosomal protein S18 acetylase RimI-like enzyme